MFNSSPAMCTARFCAHTIEEIMPLTLTLTDGILPKGQEKVAYKRLSEAMLAHGLAGNKIMTPNVVGSIHVVDKDHTFTGMDETPVAFIESAVLCLRGSQDPGGLLRGSHKHHP